MMSARLRIAEWRRCLDRAESDSRKQRLGSTSMYTTGYAAFPLLVAIVSLRRAVDARILRHSQELIQALKSHVQPTITSTLTLIFFHLTKSYDQYFFVAKSGHRKEMYKNIR